MKRSWKFFCVALFGSLAGIPGVAESVMLRAQEFETPVRLEADGQPIKVEEPGYACPSVADVDGDGSPDLVVGQFNEGHMQFFKNLAASGETPRLAAAQWLKTGEERAIVPGVW
jgi:hypothetical protein